MEYPVSVSKDAERDILTAKCHYRISGVEKSFDDDLVRQVSYLRANPFLFQIYYRNVRRVHFNRFPYSIHYVIKNDIVYILRVLHHGQKFN